MRLGVIIIVVIYIILIATDIIIFNDLGGNLRLGIKRFPDNIRISTKRSKIFAIFALLTLSLLTVTICLPRRSETGDITSIMWLLYIVTTILISQLVYSIFSLIGYIPLILGKKKIKSGLWLGLPVALVIFFTMWWGALIGRERIKTTHIEISSARLPDSFDGFKIAQISDLHVGTWGNDTSFVSTLVDSVNNLHPDVIVFTGDIVNRETKEIYPFIKSLSRLKSPYGVYSVLGNHDYGDYIAWHSQNMKKANLDSLIYIQNKMGWKMLNNSHVFIKNKKNDSIALIGVENWGEPPFSQYGKLSMAYPESGYYDDHFKILLSHNPEHWNREVSKVSNIDLTLSGHTHGMQMIFKLGNWKWSPAQYKYSKWQGLYSKNVGNGKSQLYVNIGAGEVGIPMRIGADPEITLFTLSSGK